jgi:hypothetical protein
VSPFSLQHRQVLEDAIFDLLQAEVIFVQDRLGPDQIDLVFAQLVPRQIGQPIEVGADHRRLGRLGVHLLQAPQLLVRFPRDLTGQVGVSEPGPQLFDLVLFVVGVAEFVPDLLELLPEEIFALGLGHLLLGLALDLLLPGDDLDLLEERVVDPPQPITGRGGLQNRLGVGHF